MTTICSIMSDLKKRSEVMRLQTFQFAELTLAIDAPQRLLVGEKWAKFAAPDAQPNLLYDVTVEQVLPEGSAQLLYRDRRVRVRRAGCAKEYIYSNPYTNSDSAMVLRHRRENGCIRHQITVLQERLPWGTAVEHFFELYDLAHCLPQFGKVLLHCAYVLYEGKAILFTAPSGTGKSTQAELWKACLGARIINGDRAAVGIHNGRAMAYAVPFSGSSDDCENVDAPIAAIVSLSQAKHNELTRLSGREAVRQLLRGTYLLPEHQEDLPLQMDIAADLLQHIPIYHLACLPEASAVQLLSEELQKIHRDTVL